MTNELEPCPFCGGEAEVDWFYLKDEPWKVRVCCRQCAGNIYERATTHYHDCINHYESVEKAESAAVNEWNTRYKRTCKPHVVERHIKVEGDEHSFWQALCDCGWIVGEDGTPNLSEFEHVDNFCGGCGCEVVVDCN